MTRTVIYKGLKIMQTDYNHHIAVIENDAIVFRAQCDKAKTDEELRQIGESYLMTKDSVSTYLDNKNNTADTADNDENAALEAYLSMLEEQYENQFVNEASNLHHFC